MRKTTPCRMSSSTNVRKTKSPRKMNKNTVRKKSAQTNRQEITHFSKKNKSLGFFISDPQTVNNTSTSLIGSCYLKNPNLTKGLSQNHLSVLWKNLFNSLSINICSLKLVLMITSCSFMWKSSWEVENESRMEWAFKNCSTLSFTTIVTPSLFRH
jgi:hypothetical protein